MRNHRCVLTVWIRVKLRLRCGSQWPRAQRAVRVRRYKVFALVVPWHGAQRFGGLPPHFRLSAAQVPEHNLTALERNQKLICVDDRNDKRCCWRWWFGCVFVFWIWGNFIGFIATNTLFASRGLSARVTTAPGWIFRNLWRKARSILVVVKYGCSCIVKHTIKSIIYCLNLLLNLI